MKYIHPVIENILTRESCRQFKTDKVDREDLELLTQAAVYAPNAGGRQPWHISVVTNEDTLNLIADECYKGYLEAISRERKPDDIESRHVGDFRRGGVINGREGFPPAIFVLSEEPEMTPGAACWLAAENIMLAAKACRLDSLCMAAINANVIGKFLSQPDCPECIRALVPEGYSLVCTIGVGYADWNAFRAPRVERRENTVEFFE